MVAEAITFGDTAERLMEVLLVVIVGVALAVHWDPRALLLALALFVVIRPLATHVLLAASPTTLPQRWLMGWFGIRGIGSIYYLAYALSHGAVGAGAAAVVDLTVSVVAISIVLHGITIQPLLAWYERRLHHGDRAASPRTT
jgi:NhaP-type Na+/H+ or K+/H+ antiporter